MDVNLSLREKTVLITGPFTPMIQYLVHQLTQSGADCVLADPNAKVSVKFCNQINDQREVNPKYGRALSLESDFYSLENIKETVSAAAQAYGGIDVYLDFLMYSGSNKNLISDLGEGFLEMINYQLRAPMAFTGEVLNYFKSRKKGRIIYFFNEGHEQLIYKDLLPHSIRSALTQYTKGISKSLIDTQITINSISLGLTEEYILGHFPESKSIREIISMLKEKEPTLKITEPERVAQAISFLISNAGLGVTGQHIHLT